MGSHSLILFGPSLSPSLSLPPHPPHPHPSLRSPRFPQNPLPLFSLSISLSPHLAQDPMFSECMSFPIHKEGSTLVGSGEDADVRLTGDDILPRHATINFRLGETEKQKLTEKPECGSSGVVAAAMTCR